MSSSLKYSRSERQRRYDDTSRSDDERTPFERDQSRIIHSAAFRRLQGKTQVFGMGGSDFFRTRLTHSLEVAQIGKGIALRVGANPDLVDRQVVIDSVSEILSRIGDISVG